MEKGSASVRENWSSFVLPPAARTLTGCHLPYRVATRPGRGRLVILPQARGRPRRPRSRATAARWRGAACPATTRVHAASRFASRPGGWPVPCFTSTLHAPGSSPPAAARGACPSSWPSCWPRCSRRPPGGWSSRAADRAAGHARHYCSRQYVLVGLLALVVPAFVEPGGRPEKQRRGGHAQGRDAARAARRRRGRGGPRRSTGASRTGRRPQTGSRAEFSPPRSCSRSRTTTIAAALVLAFFFMKNGTRLWGTSSSASSTTTSGPAWRRSTDRPRRAQRLRRRGVFVVALHRYDASSASCSSHPRRAAGHAADRVQPAGPRFFPIIGSILADVAGILVTGSSRTASRPPSSSPPRSSPSGVSRATSLPRADRSPPRPHPMTILPRPTGTS